MTQAGKSQQARQRTDYTRDVVDRHADVLSERHLEILRSASNGANYREIGTWLGLPPGTVRSRLNRARAALAEAIRVADLGPDKKYPNGAPKFAADGTLLDDQGNRSIFDDVDQ